MSASRQNLEIAPAEADAEGNLSAGEFRVFTYQYPFITITSKSRTKKHEPIGTEPVVQSLGPEIREITIEGHCYIQEANFVDALNEGGLVQVVSDRWNGYGVVDGADTKPTGQGGGKAGTTADRLYEYKLDLLELTDNRPDSIGGFS